MSGSGVSTAMGILEDLGFYCVEKLPCEIIPNLAVLINQGRFNNVAIATSMKEIECTYIKLTSEGLEPKVILTDANNETISKRYKLTKHLHPKVIEQKFYTLDEAIEDDRKEFEELPRFKDCLIINTESYNQEDLRAILKTRINYVENKMIVIFKVFGFKYGLQGSADLVIDTRMLPNPFWVPELREKTGDDKEVYDYVLEAEKTKNFLEKLVPYIDYVLEEYCNEGKSHITIAIGCTGGQHRSLSIANYLNKRYKEKYNCILKRRS